MGVESPMHDVENSDKNAANNTRENEPNIEFARGGISTSQMTKHHLSSFNPLT